MIALSALAFLALSARAQVAPSTATLTLEQRVELLEKAAGGSWRFPGDANATFKLHALIQADERFVLPPLATASTFVMRRVRPILEGNFLDDYSLFIVPDFGSGATVLFDAALDIKPWSFGGLRVGKFKPPVGLERLQTDADLPFAERGLPSDLLPQRDVGAMVFGDFGAGVFTYQAALTNGVADGSLGDTAANGGKEGALRLFVSPVKGLGLGMAGTYTNANSLTPTFKTSSSQQTFFTYAAGAAASGQRYRLAPQINYYRGPFGFYAEYVSSTQRFQLGTVRRHLTNQAGQAAVSVVLTGEDKTYKSVEPKNKKWGALELDARFHQIWIDRESFQFGFANAASSARKATSWTAGFNWTLNTRVKFVLDYEQTWFNGGVSGGNRPLERVFLARWQLAL
jgi:phosphate-selective porin OprO/OprP